MQLLQNCGLEPVVVTPLPAIIRAGLWERVHTLSSRPSPGSIASFAALWAAAPLLNHRSTSDIVLVLAKRAGSASAPSSAANAFAGSHNAD